MDCSCGNNPKDEEMNSILEKYSKDKSNLIQILNEVQENYGYIPKYSQISISEYLDIPLAEIYGVITFYARFTLKPKGKYNIAVCLGTACFVKGSEKVLDKAKEILKIDVGETTEDGKFSLEATRCIGACGLAPVFTVNEEVYGKATPELMEKVIAEFHPDCTEMEGASIAQAATLNNIPYVVIRAISDKADGSAQEDYQTFEKKAAEHCAKLVQEMMKEL